MSQYDADIKFYEKNLNLFFDAVNWNKSADLCVQKILKGQTTTHSQEDESPDSNPYSDEPFLPSPTLRGSSTAPHPSSVVHIDAEKQREILKPFWKSASPDTRSPPRCLAEEWLLFSTEERRALHQYALQHTVPPPTPPELLLKQPEPSADNLTDVELKKRQRDMTRRRQAYRTTATGSKSLTEVTREMIDNIMEMIGAEKDTTSKLRSDSGKEKRMSPGHFSSGEHSEHHHRHRSPKKDLDRKKRRLEPCADETKRLDSSENGRQSRRPSLHRRDSHKHHKRESPDRERSHRSKHKSSSKKSRRNRSGSRGREEKRDSKYIDKAFT